VRRSMFAAVVVLASASSLLSQAALAQWWDLPDGIDNPRPRYYDYHPPGVFYGDAGPVGFAASGFVALPFAASPPPAYGSAATATAMGLLTWHLLRLSPSRLDRPTVMSGLRTRHLLWLSPSRLDRPTVMSGLRTRHLLWLSPSRLDRLTVMSGLRTRHHPVAVPVAPRPPYGLCRACERGTSCGGPRCASAALRRLSLLARWHLRRSTRLLRIATAKAGLARQHHVSARGTSDSHGRQDRR
jgi:hypothetical protein